MDSPKDLVSLTILNQREALYQLHNQFNVSRSQLEILAFANVKMFFTLYEVYKYYPHTNIQHIRRGLNDLTQNGFMRKISNGVKSKPANFTISPSGKLVLKKYAAIIIPDPNVRNKFKVAKSA